MTSQDVLIAVGMVVIFFLILALDGWIYRRTGNSFSRVIIKLSKLSPFFTMLVSLVIGFLLGHWFG